MNGDGRRGGRRGSTVVAAGEQQLVEAAVSVGDGYGVDVGGAGAARSVVTLEDVAEARLDPVDPLPVAVDGGAGELVLDGDEAGDPACVRPHLGLRHGATEVDEHGEDLGK